MPENEDKKNYLNSYYYLTLEEIQLSERIEELKSKMTGSAIQYSDMPKAHDSNHDLSAEFAKIDEEVSRLIKKMEQAIDRYREIESAIENLSDEKEIAVLKYRYLSRMKWEEIAVAMNYGFQWILKLHGKALHHFQIPNRR